MATLELKNVSKIFRQKGGDEVYAVRDLNLSIADKELVVLLGPSGCGKTTTLRLIAGLEAVSAGVITINGADVNEVPPQDRDIAMVFQRDALYPHMTVFENMAFGLTLRKISKPEIETRVQSTAETLGITSLLARYPRALSGGERQRTALGRALVRKPQLLLLDEPLSQLDRPLRAQLRAEIARVQQSLAITMLYVTHDQAEAVALGQRIAVMNEGALQQVADSNTLQRHPANHFVTQFLSHPGSQLSRGSEN